MDLLILGGTGFLGRHLVEAALGYGHRPTLFNRGLHEPELFPEVEKIEGNREGDLSALRGRRCNAVIDTCGYVPRVVGASARLLAGAVDHYTFVSSISVYPEAIAPGADEEAPVRELPDPTVEEVTGETYGGAQGAVRAGRRGDDAGQGIERPSWFDLWSARSHGPFHVLAASDGRWWRSAGPGSQRAQGAVHRRARSRDVDREDVCGATDRNVQRHRS